MGEIVDFHGRLFGESSSLHGLQQVVGSGTEHQVFNHPYFDQMAREGHPSAAVVQKINLASLRESSDETREESIATVLALAETRNRRHQQLRTVFGEDIVPGEDTVACRLWLRAADIHRLWPEKIVNGVGDVYYATVTWQDKVWELDPSHYDPAGLMQLRLPYAERQPGAIDGALYAAVNDRWITRADDGLAPTRQETRQLLAVQQSPWLAELLAAATSEPAVATGIRRVVGGAIKYGQLYGEPLDLMGEKNLIVTRQGQVRLVDMLIPPEAPILWQAPAILAKVANFEALARKEVIVLLNSLGHIRTMNFLAAWLGMPDRIIQDAPRLDRAAWETVQRTLATSSLSKYLLAATVQY